MEESNQFKLGQRVSNELNDVGSGFILKVNLSRYCQNEFELFDFEFDF